MRLQSVYVLFWAIFCSEVVIPRKIRLRSVSDSEDRSSSEDSESDDLRDEYHELSVTLPHAKKNHSSLRYKLHKRNQFVSYITLPPPVFTSTKAPQNKLPRGPFFGFLRNICNAIISPKFNVKFLGKYYHTLSKSLNGFGINFIQKLWIKRFQRKLKKYSIYNKKILKSKAKAFLDFISDGKPKKIAYFEAMNTIYTVEDDRKMDDYVFVLKNYGKGLVRHIGSQTRRIFERIIFGRYKRKDEDIQDEIELKFKSALVEYWENRLNRTNHNSTLGHLFNYTFNLP